jgi:hypothetical protein
VISRYLAGPAALADGEGKPDNTHGPLIWPPLLDALVPLIVTGGAPGTLGDAMEGALRGTIETYPVLKKARWKAEPLHPRNT